MANEHDIPMAPEPLESAAPREGERWARVRPTKKQISEVMAHLGAKGGKVRSAKKTAAVRENARKPRPGRRAK